MSAAVTSEVSPLTRGDLSKYPKGVADVLLKAVNTYGVPYRLIDGSHLRLYNGDREVTPFKAAASRQEKYTLQYLNRWLMENWPRWAEDHVQDRSETSEEAEAEAEVTPEPEKPSDGDLGEEERWEPHLTNSGKSHGFETNGKVYRCIHCGYQQSYGRGLHLHAATHEDPDLWYRAARGRRAARERQQAEAEETKAVDAVRVLAAHHGLDLVDSEEVARLREEVTNLTKERDDALARLSLVKEAFGA